MDRLNIDDIKAIELNIMDEIDRVCTERGLQYFLGYGSLLGAVRHSGFIPWDDDIDILMMRSDYEKLMTHFNEWVGSGRFRLVSYRDESSIYQFAKVVDTTTVMYENFVGKKRATGVWVDVFPLENFDSYKRSLLKKRDRVGLIRSFAVADPSFGSNALVKVAKRIVCPFAARKNPYELARRLDDIALEMNESQDADCVIDVLGYGAAPHSKKLFEPVRMKFEDRQYWAPRGYEDYLTAEYGDWRTPPAENNRPIHTMEAYRL